MSYTDPDRKRTRTAWQRERRDKWEDQSFTFRESLPTLLFFTALLLGAILI